MRLLRSLSLLVVLSLVVAACGGEQAGDTANAKERTVKVVIALPTDLELYNEIYRGAQLAYEEAGGKAGSTHVELVLYKTNSPDYALSPELEKQAAEAAAKDNAVVAYIGFASSGQARAALPVLNQAGIASLTATATWPGLTKSGFGAGEPAVYYPTGQRNLFRLVPSDEIQGVVAAHWAEELGLKKVFLVDDGSPYATGLVGIFETTAQDLDLEIVGKAQFDPKTSTPDSYAALAQQIVGAQPDLVYFGGYAFEGGSTLVGALRRAQPDLPIMGADALALHMITIEENGADLVEGVYATDVSIPPEQWGTDAAKMFIAAYQAKYNRAPVGLSAHGYDAMRLILHAIGKSPDPTRANVRDALAALSDFSGMSGAWTFDANGDIASRAISGWQIQDGQWRFVQILR